MAQIPEVYSIWVNDIYSILKAALKNIFNYNSEQKKVYIISERDRPTKIKIMVLSLGKYSKLKGEWSFEINLLYSIERMLLDFKVETLVLEKGNIRERKLYTIDCTNKKKGFKVLGSPYSPDLEQLEMVRIHIENEIALPLLDIIENKLK